MDKISAYNIIVTGRVQGVFYRASTHDKANELKLYGWVRNLPNGDVEIFAEGSEKSLIELIAWCKKGPIMAKVIDVKAEAADLKKYQQFEIRY